MNIIYHLNKYNIQSLANVDLVHNILYSRLLKETVCTTNDKNSLKDKIINCFKILEVLQFIQPNPKRENLYSINKKFNESFRQLILPGFSHYLLDLLD